MCWKVDDWTRYTQALIVKDSAAMEMTTTYHGDVPVLAFKGRLDAVSSMEVEPSVLGLIEQGKKKLVLDLNGLEYVSSAGLRVLLLAAKRLLAVGGQLRTFGLTQPVRQVLQMTGLIPQLGVVDSLEESLR